MNTYAFIFATEDGTERRIAFAGDTAEAATESATRSLLDGEHIARRLPYDTELDRDQLDKLAADALERPSNCAMWDERIYTTWAPVFSWADRGDDLISESNFHVMLAELTALDSEHVEDISVSHWAVGSLRQVLVQVRTDDGSDFTPAFVKACDMVLYLRDEYPLLDDGDHSDREWKAFEAVAEDVLNDAESDFEDELTDELRAELRELALDGVEDCTPDGAWYSVRESYDELRQAWIDGQTWRLSDLDNNPDQPAMFTVAGAAEYDIERDILTTP